MTLSHIGHDTQIGEGVILANGATLAGHVIVEDFAVVGALNLVHQNCTVGRYAYLGGGTTVTQDVLPYSLTSVRRENRAFGLNKVGLTRRGFTPEELQQLRQAYRLLQVSHLNTGQALEAIRAKVESGEFGERVGYLAEFLAKSERASSSSCHAHIARVGTYEFWQEPAWARLLNRDRSKILAKAILFQV